MKQSINFIHLSDIHLTPAVDKAIYGMTLDRQQKFDRIFEDIKKRQLHPDFFVISGDLIHEGTAEDYRELHRLIEEKQDMLNVPGFVCLGNHDERPAFWSGYKQTAENSDQSYYYSVRIGDLRLIVLDSKITGREEGVISEKQLKWLEAQFKEPAPMGTIIVLHHPLQTAPLDFMNYSILQNTKELLEILKGRDVLAVLSGHIHFSAAYDTGGIANFVAPAVSYGIDCSSPLVHHFMDDSGYQVISLANGQIVAQQWSLPATKNIVYELQLDKKEIHF
ncbi:MAG: metallophosphoesterase [Sporolactobacillus sp.]